MRIAVITVSDTVAKREKEDASGPAVVAVCRGLGWEIISTQVVSDDLAGLTAELRALAHVGRIDVILTTGGTGLGPRDNTPEATLAVADRVIPGIGEEMRRAGMAKISTAVLSRAVAVIAGGTIIVNLPGSPKGAAESLDSIAHLLPQSFAACGARVAWRAARLALPRVSCGSRAPAFERSGSKAAALHGLSAGPKAWPTDRGLTYWRKASTILRLCLLHRLLQKAGLLLETRL
jgi:molybdopterin adenylyltransferase